MNILAFSDAHCNVISINKILEKSKAVDLVIGAGDFSHGGGTGLKEVIKKFSQINKPCVFVPGNCETFQQLNQECKNENNLHILHGTGIKLNGVEIFGVGGGIPVTPFGSWSYDFTEAQARDLLLDCVDGCILVTHSPPKGILDTSSSGKSLGSLAIREVLEKKRIKLLVCGHIHASSGKIQRIGHTDVINAGGYGVVYIMKE
jgi:Icc-related predicted phosphoesterase